MSNADKIVIAGYLPTRHEVRCAMFDPCPSACDCQPKSRPVVTLATALALQQENDQLQNACKKALDAMEQVKKLLKAAGFVMEGGTASEPYSEAMDGLRKVLNVN